MRSFNGQEVQGEYYHSNVGGFYTHDVILMVKKFEEENIITQMLESSRAHEVIVMVEEFKEGSPELRQRRRNVSKINICCPCLID